MAPSRFSHVDGCGVSVYTSRDSAGSVAVAGGRMWDYALGVVIGPKCGFVLKRIGPHVG
jgi:hypothetical protein